MTPDEVAARVEFIRSITADEESAHGEEDRLHRDVLHAIADGAPYAPDLASAALRTLAIDYTRWYA